MKENIIENIAVKNDEIWQKAIENESWIKPIVDIVETQNNFKLYINLPGISKENIKLKLEKNVLSLMALNDVEKKSSYNYILKESDLANYARTFTLAEDIIDTQNISAEYSNGILELTLPKKEKAIPKQIEIK
jgi:HSP20 family protein